MRGEGICPQRGPIVDQVLTNGASGHSLRAATSAKTSYILLKTGSKTEACALRYANSACLAGDPISP
eukprot:9472465-Pyramimonas_sp.AAC.3